MTRRLMGFALAAALTTPIAGSDPGADIRASVGGAWSQLQADAILVMQLRALTGLEAYRAAR